MGGGGARGGGAGGAAVEVIPVAIESGDVRAFGLSQLGGD